MLRLLVLLACLSVGLVEGKKLTHKEYELFEGATDEPLIMNHPVAIQAGKMSRLLRRQDVISTCRYMLFKAYKNFYDAKHACENVEWPFTHQGANLAYVHTEEENTEIRILLQLAHGIRFVERQWNRDNWVWVGIEKKRNNNRRLNNNEKAENWNASDWEWLDGSSPNYTQWMRGMPDQMYRRNKGYQNHAMINKRGWWDDTFASIEAPYACNYCGKYIVIEEHVSWTRARKLCESYGLTMAKVNSKEENLELAWAANLTFGPDTEKKRWNDTNWIWLGTKEIMEEDENGTLKGTNKWEHHDNTTLEWSPIWDRKRQPDNWVKIRGEQSVVAFSRINQKWDDSFIWKMRPFACMCPHRTCHYPASHPINTDHDHDFDTNYPH